MCLMCEQCESEFTPHEVRLSCTVCLLCQLVNLLDLPADFFTKEN
ncbi:hypothetical protein SAMN05216275_10552 [Streptosporangium canum]|uniref:Uncharacterized protein n=1 Tax=Streptosporangium canum TaxID=324952 RepID=A0A1I3L8X4_9ACTN|nr:hypothetical protein SAMN05216275_10552 [Streptosporangium canum]